MIEYVVSKGLCGKKPMVENYINEIDFMSQAENHVEYSMVANVFMICISKYSLCPKISIHDSI